MNENKDRGRYPLEQPLKEWLIEGVDPKHWNWNYADWNLFYADFDKVRTASLDKISVQSTDVPPELYALGITGRVGAGHSMFQVIPAVPCRIVGLVFDDVQDLAVTSITAGRCELTVVGGEIPASLFSSALCANCRRVMCQALVGKNWPRLWPGTPATLYVLNLSDRPRDLRAAFVIEEERVNVLVEGDADDAK